METIKINPEGRSMCNLGPWKRDELEYICTLMSQDSSMSITIVATTAALSKRLKKLQWKIK